jgi:O-antigen/teichoic acid export membrane protein
MATALSKEYFGIFMIIRRIIGVGAPLITLNLGVGLARYVSYEREKEGEFLNASLCAITIISALVIVSSIIFRNQLSLVFFNTSNYSLFVVLTAFFLFSYATYTISYVFFQGRLEMHRANRMQILYYLFPAMAGLILWQLFTDQYSKILSFYLFFFSLCYSLSRIPSGFFLALIFGIPVFVASHKISLVAAGYAGIAVAIVRLMEVFATPFNLLFLPKFAEIKRNNVEGEISNKVSIVTSFIFTALPLIAVASYGLAEYAVIIFFGSKYIPAAQGVSVVILFSAFYVSYVLIRGILDGLFSFPYVNIICLAGFLTTAISSFLFHGSVFVLALDFGLGLLVMGVTALCILIKRANISVQLNEILVSLIVALLAFVSLFYLDKWMELTIFNEYIKFGVKIVYRVILFLALYRFYWKPKSLWVKELLYRTGI